jgi:hypothetical protein
MSIIHKINNLPNELQDKIYNIYWMKKYNDNVICHFKMLNTYHSRIQHFLNNHFLAIRLDTYDNLHYDFLKEINNILLKISNDKSSFLYLIGKDVYMKTIKSENTIVSLCNEHISPNIMIVAIYSIIISNIYFFDFNTFERFKKLSNTNIPNASSFF